ncbi:MAG: hypothetical protein ACRCZW_10050, partial [Lactobacillaceae bacterium]
MHKVKNTSTTKNQHLKNPRKAENFWGTLFRLMTYLKKYTIAVVVVVILAIGSQIFQVQTP